MELIEFMITLFVFLLLIIVMMFFVYIAYLIQTGKLSETGMFWTEQEIEAKILKTNIAIREDILKKTDNPLIVERITETLEENYAELKALKPVSGFELIQEVDRKIGK